MDVYGGNIDVHGGNIDVHGGSLDVAINRIELAGFDLEYTGEKARNNLFTYKEIVFRLLVGKEAEKP